MMRVLVERVRRAVEKRLGVPADYIAELGKASFSGFVKFVLFLPLAGHRRKADATLLHAARLVVFQHDDCGSCLQGAINVALAEGVAPQIIEAVLARDHSAMSQQVSLVTRFAQGILAMDCSEQAPRVEISTQYGTTVLAELSLAIASARVFPTLKRGLGYAGSCTAPRLAVPFTAKTQGGNTHEIESGHIARN